MNESTHSTLRALAGGFAGAAALTLLHETARRFVPKAPRMDLVGMRGIARLMRAAGRRPPAPGRLHHWSLLADIASNGLYYSLVGDGTSKRTWLRGTVLGGALGASGVTLPPLLGVEEPPEEQPLSTQAMTVAWYVAGGLAAAGTARVLARRSGCRTDG